MKGVLGILVTFLIFFPSTAFAVSVTISNTPSTITDQPFNVNVSVSGAQSGTNYLRANLFPAGTTKYFGYTFNGSSFANSSNYSDYLPVTIDSSGGWSGTIQAKLDTDSSYFNGSGSYNLKVRRYTQSGSSYTWSNEVSLAVDFQTPAPSSTSTFTPTSSPHPTSTPTSTLIPTTQTASTSKAKTTSTSNSSAATPKPTIVASVQNNVNSDSLTTKSIVKIDYQIASIAGATASATPQAEVEVKNEKRINFLPWIGGAFVTVGLGTLAYVYLHSRKLI